MTQIKHSCQIGPQQYSLSKPAPFDERGYLYWHMVGYTKDIGKIQQLLTWEDVFNDWEDQLEVLKFRKTEHIKKAHLIIFWDAGDGNCYDEHGRFVKKCPYDFKLHPHVIAVCYPNGEIYGNDALFHTEKEKGRGFLLKISMKHEVGHGLGFRHTPVTTDIMGEKYNKDAVFTADTRNGAVELYGDKMVSVARKRLSDRGLLLEPEALVVKSGNRFPPSII